MKRGVFTAYVMKIQEYLEQEVKTLSSDAYPLKWILYIRCQKKTINKLWGPFSKTLKLLDRTSYNTTETINKLGFVTLSTHQISLVIKLSSLWNAQKSFERQKGASQSPGYLTVQLSSCRTPLTYHRIATTEKCILWHDITRRENTFVNYYHVY